MFEYAFVRARSALCLVLAAGTPLALANAADSPAEDRLDQVVITASPLREAASGIAQPSSVMKGDDLVRARAVSLGESLANQPGVTATWFGPQASRPIIRGQGGERVQIFADGSDALDVAGLSVDHAVTIDPLVAERVEVLRGPATLLFGNSAAAGLVNVVSNRIPQRQPDAPFSGALEIRGDTALAERSLAARADGGSNRWAWHADAHKRDTDDVQIADFALSPALRATGELEADEIAASRGRLANSASDSRGAALGVSRVGESGFVGASVSHFATNYGIPGPGEQHEDEDELPQAIEMDDDGGVTIDMQQTRFDTAAELRLNSDRATALRFHASYNDYEHVEFEPSGEAGTTFDQQGIDGRLLLDHRAVGGWSGTAGLQYRETDFVAAGAEVYVPPSKTRNVGVFVFEKRSFGQLTAEFGARFEKQKIMADNEPASYQDELLNIAGGLLWQLSDTWTIASNVTSTRRHPTAAELYANGPHLAVQRFEIGNSDLALERAKTVDVSLRYDDASWNLELTGFVSDYSDYIFAQPTGETEDGLPVVAYQQEDARFAGMELVATLPRVELGAGMLSTRLLADYVVARRDVGGDLPQIPPLRAGVDLRYDRQTFSAGLSANHYARQSRVADNELPTDSYTMLGLDLSVRVNVGDRKMLLFARGDNLLDEDARRHSSPLKEYAPLPGRSLGVGLRFEF